MQFSQGIRSNLQINVCQGARGLKIWSCGRLGLGKFEIVYFVLGNSQIACLKLEIVGVALVTQRGDSWQPREVL